MQLTAGGRYIDESKDSYFIQPYVNPVFGFLFIEGRTLAADQSFDDFVPFQISAFRNINILPCI